jgi:hypothetical protein
VHPEDFCERCGCANVTWLAPNEVGNAGARIPEGDPIIMSVTKEVARFMELCFDVDTNVPDGRRRVDG